MAHHSPHKPVNSRAEEAIFQGAGVMAEQRS